MSTTFLQLNIGWNAEPNAPDPVVTVEGADVLLVFYVNPYLFPEFAEEEVGVLRFVRCERYRYGTTNDEGWRLGQCRFSRLAPEWGEFYNVDGPTDLLIAPGDWQLMGPRGEAAQHYLFYLRDGTFECVAEECIIEPTAENALHRTGVRLPAPPAPESTS